MCVHVVTVVDSSTLVSCLNYCDNLGEKWCCLKNNAGGNPNIFSWLIKYMYLETKYKYCGSTNLHAQLWLENACKCACHDIMSIN